MHLQFFKTFAVLLLLSLGFGSCDTSDPYDFSPDFSTVPDAYNYSSREPIEVEEGVTAYVLEANTVDHFSVTARDNIRLHLTLRAEDGEIIYSTFNNGNETPIGVFVGNTRITEGQNPYNYSITWAFSQGLYSGLLGMKEGEKRTLIVSQEKGFGESHGTLQYDIILSEINY